MPTLKEAAKIYEPKTSMKNIADLPEVSTDIELKEKSGINNETQEEYNFQYIEINGESYRVPYKVIGDIKVILGENPELKKFKVKRQGEGRSTKYTVIPLA